MEIDLSRVLLCLGIGVVSFKSSLQDGVAGGDFGLKDEFESILVDLLDICPELSWEARPLEPTAHPTSKTFDFGPTEY